jgi:hypothetical protein
LEARKSPEGAQYLRIESFQDSGSPFDVAPHFVRDYSHSATLWQEEMQLFLQKHYFIVRK